MVITTENMRMHKNGQRVKSALDITTKAVTQFSEDLMTYFVDNKLVEINTKNKQETGTIFTSCKIQNLLSCPTGKICKKHKGHCKFHSKPDLLPRPCPNGICDNIRNEIISHHRFLSPYWKNTKAEEWCTNSWQVAKCFFQQDGYGDVCYPGDTDFNGLMSLFMSCTLFEDSFNDDLSQEGNVCSRARKVRNLFCHAPPYRISDSQLSSSFDALVAFLSDSKHLNNNPKAKRGLELLTKLKSCPYLISIEDEIVIEPLTSSSSDESSLKEDMSGDSSEGSSDVNDGWETDRDSLSHDSVSLTSDDNHEDSHGIQSTENQSVINRFNRRALQTSEADIQLFRETEADGKTRNTSKDNVLKRILLVGLFLRRIAGLAVDIVQESILEIVCLVVGIILNLISLNILIEIDSIRHVIIPATGELFIEENALWKLFFVSFTIGMQLIMLLIFRKKALCILKEIYGHVKRKLS